ncbi:hypothetical protein Lser_V15G38620 [Lactuca serriola]
MAGGSKRVPNQEKSNTESKSKDETQGETQIESKPEDEQKSASSVTTAEAKGKGKEKKPVSPKGKSPMDAAKKGKAKGIVIGEAKEPETETTVEKSGKKRKREFAVKSCYSLRSGLKGTAVEVGQQKKVGRKSAVKKVKGEK